MRTYQISVFRQTDRSVLSLWDGNGRRIDERSLSRDEVDAFVSAVDAGYSSISPSLPELGSRLYDWLDGERRWMELIRRTPEGMTLHIDMEERLRHLPWELLHARGGWLCGNVAHSFTPVRRSGMGRRQPDAANRPLRVLFMASSPENVQPVLAFEREEAMILGATRRWPTELVVEESGSLSGLRETVLAHGPGHFDVLHLTGHAVVQGDTPGFVLEDDLGFASFATAEQFMEVLGGIWPRLVFLSGCRTGQSPQGGVVPSLAERLVEAGAPAVLGWSLPVEDRSASAAAAELFEHLAAGLRIDEAVARTRRRLLEAESTSWHLLRLYADATPLTPLVTPLKTPGREPQRTRPAAMQFLDAGRHVGKVPVCTREDFVGRRRAIQRCLRALQSVQGDPGYAEGVLLHGMGGLGKSSLAAQICERMADYSRLVRIGAVDETAFLHILADGVPTPEAAKLLNLPQLTLKQRLIRVLDGPLASRRCLFVFDDFEYNLEGVPGSEPVIDSAAGARLRADAAAVLFALLEAIRETGSASRVIVTSRYWFAPPAPVRLHAEGLERLRGADLGKKLSQLSGFQRVRHASSAMHERALSAAAGNPRLLEWLSRAFEDAGTEETTLLEAMEGVEERFREHVLLRTLLGRQEPELRRMLALLSVYRRPVSAEAARAVAGESVDRFLARAAMLGLVEQGTVPGTAEARFYVSSLVGAEARAEVSTTELVECRRQAVRHLYRKILQTQRADDEEMLEVLALALPGNEREIYLQVAFLLSNRWLFAARFREAALLCSNALRVAIEPGLLHLLAQATLELGDIPAAEGYYRQALRAIGSPEGDEKLREKAQILYNFSTLLYGVEKVEEADQVFDEAFYIRRKLKDELGIAACLHARASRLREQGRFARALQMAKRSLALHRKIGDSRGEAACLHLIGIVHLDQNNPGAAFKALERALQIYRTTIDRQGFSQTLLNMSLCMMLQGERLQAQRAAYEAAAIMEETGDYDGLLKARYVLALTLSEQPAPPP